MIELPRTPTRRNAIAFLRLLSSVSEQAETGFDFKGTTHRPGASIPFEQLWPTPQHPFRPIALEVTQVEFGGRGHKRNPLLYVLWRFDLDLNGWVEVARYSSFGLDWVTSIAAIARRFLALDGRRPEPPLDVHLAMRRIIAAVEQELSNLPREERCQLLGAVHTYLSGELVQHQPGLQMRLGWEKYFDGHFGA